MADTPDWAELHNTLLGQMYSPEFMSEYPELAKGGSVSDYSAAVGETYEKALRNAGVPLQLIRDVRGKVEAEAGERGKAFALAKLKEGYLAEGDKNFGMMTGRYLAERVPGANLGYTLSYFKQLKGSADRLEKGEAISLDYERIAKHLAREEYEANKGYGQTAVDAVTHVPGLAAEFLLTGGAATATRTAAKEAVGQIAAKYLGKHYAGRVVAKPLASAVGYGAGLGAQVSMLPSTGVAAAQANFAEGRDPMSPEGIPGAIAHGMVQLAILSAVAGPVGKLIPGQGVASKAGRALGQGFAFPVGAAGADVASSAVGLDQGYGVPGMIARKEYGPAGKAVIGQAAQGVAFAIGHEATRPAGQRPLTTQFEKIKAAVEAERDRLMKQGLRKDSPELHEKLEGYGNRFAQKFTAPPAPAESPADLMQRSAREGAARMTQEAAPTEAAAPEAPAPAPAAPPKAAESAVAPEPFQAERPAAGPIEPAAQPAELTVMTPVGALPVSVAKKMGYRVDEGKPTAPVETVQAAPVVEQRTEPQGWGAAEPGDSPNAMPADVAATRKGFPKGIHAHPAQDKVRESATGWILNDGGEHWKAYPESRAQGNAPLADKPLPMPEGGEAARSLLGNAWDVVSRLWPEMAGKIKKVKVLAFGDRKVRAALNDKTGTLIIPEGRQVEPDALWHELVHVEQKEQGRHVPAGKRSEAEHLEMEREAHVRAAQMRKAHGWKPLAMEKSEGIDAPEDSGLALEREIAKARPAAPAQGKRSFTDKPLEPAKNLDEAIGRVRASQKNEVVGTVRDFLGDAGPAGKGLSEAVGGVRVVVSDVKRADMAAEFSFDSTGEPVVILSRKSMKGKSPQQIAAKVAHEAAHVARFRKGRTFDLDQPYDRQVHEQSAGRAEKAVLEHLQGSTRAVDIGSEEYRRELEREAREFLPRPLPPEPGIDEPAAARPAAPTAAPQAAPVVAPQMEQWIGKKQDGFSFDDFKKRAMKHGLSKDGAGKELGRLIKEGKIVEGYDEEGESIYYPSKTEAAPVEAKVKGKGKLDQAELERTRAEKQARGETITNPSEVLKKLVPPPDVLKAPPGGAVPPPIAQRRSAFGEVNPPAPPEQPRTAPTLREEQKARLLELRQKAVAPEVAPNWEKMSPAEKTAWAEEHGAKPKPGGVQGFIADESGALNVDAFRELARKGLSAANVVGSWFRSRGNFPKHTFDEKRANDHRINLVSQEVAYAFKDVQEAVAEGFGKPYTKLDPLESEAINRALYGDPQAMSRMPGQVGRQIQHLREQVDIMSAALRQSGAVAGPLAAVIKGNEGFYLTRNYRVFTEPEWASKVPEDVKNYFRSWMRSELQARGSQATPERVEGIMESLLYNGTAAESPIAFLAKSKLGSKDLGIFQKRKDIPAPLRALWGESHDALNNYAQTVTRQAQILSNHMFLTEVLREGHGKYFFDEPSVEAKVQMSSEGSKSMDPLNGVWTTPEIKKAFEEVYVPQHIESWSRSLARVANLAKYAKTVGSPVTHVGNATSNIGFLIANGAFDVRKAIPAMRVFLSDSPASRAKYREWTENGVVGQGVNEGEFRSAVRAIFRDKDASAGGASANVIIDRLKDSFKKDVMKKAEYLYHAEDGIPRAYVYENVKADYARAYPHWTELQLQKKAAEIVSNTMPSYEMVPRAVKAIHKMPITGPFVSWFAEVVRITPHIIKQTLTELATPETRWIGAKRLAGLVAAVAATDGMRLGVRALLGISADDEEAMRRFAPPWSENSPLLHLGKNEKGQDGVVDMQKMDPFAYLKKPVIAALRSRGPIEATVAAIKELGEPFWSEELVIKKALDIARNKRDTGAPVWNPQAPVQEKVARGAMHAGEAFVPGYVESARRMGMAIKGTPEPKSGKVYSVRDEAVVLSTGQRLQVIDVEKSLMFKAKKFEAAHRDVINLMSDVARKRSPVTDQELLAGREKMESQRKQVFQEFHKDIIAAQKLGMTEEDVISVLLRSGMSKKEIAAVLDNKYAPYVPPRDYLLQGAGKELEGDVPLEESIRRADVIFDAIARELYPQK